MDRNDLEYFDKKFNALDSKIEGAKEEVRVVQSNLGDRLTRHKAELCAKIDCVREDLGKQAAESGRRWAAADKEMAVHREALCPNMKGHLDDHHNAGKTIGIWVGLLTAASIGAAALVWLIERVH